MSKEIANPYFNEASQCDETYVSFVEIAYENPNLFYCTLNIDTGIGIISKVRKESLNNNLNKEKQERMLLLHRNHDNSLYDYFLENSKDIINSIDDFNYT